MTCYTFEDLGVDGFYIIDVCVCVNINLKKNILQVEDINMSPH